MIDMWLHGGREFELFHIWHIDWECVVYLHCVSSKSQSSVCLECGSVVGVYGFVSVTR